MNNTEYNNDIVLTAEMSDVLSKFKLIAKSIISKKYAEIKPEQIDAVSEVDLKNIFLEAMQYNLNTSRSKAGVFTMLVGAEDYITKDINADSIINAFADLLVEKIMNDDTGVEKKNESRSTST